MKKIVFATNNAHKLEEVRAILGANFQIISLKELGCTDDIPETANSLEGNAFLKANYIHKKFGIDCFADDTGLEIDVLNGEPGVYSARYAGEENSAIKNMQKVLGKMEGLSNRKARFRTVIALIENGTTHYFEGKVEGSMAQEPKGETGFGYDPIFIPEGFTMSFAQLSLGTKNKISHRALAIKELVNYFNTKTS